MRRMYDEKNNLTWRGFHFPRDTEDYMSDAKINMYNRYMTELNTWHGDNIERYIARGEKLGDFVEYFTSRYDYADYQTFFAFVGKDMVATAVISSQNYLNAKYALEKIIENKDVGEGAEYVTLQDAREIIDRDGDMNAIEFNYLIVNPDYQGQGVGTRVINSVTNNIDFFTVHPSDCAISAYVHRDNYPSMRAVLKNGFKVLKKSEYYNTEDYNTFFFIPKQRHFEGEKEKEN